MNTNSQIIDWKSPDVLAQIADSIRMPLNNIMEASTKKSGKSEIIISNSQQIAKLLEEVLEAANSKSVDITDKSQPLFFDIYLKNRNVQSLCNRRVDKSKISKSDKDWLVDFEKEVLKIAKESQLNLIDLSFQMSVSERQLNRKIKSLVAITPNKYIRVLKLHKAKKLIDSYMYTTISEISYAVGYFDANYFSKLFYNQYGNTPRELLLEMR